MISLSSELTDAKGRRARGWIFYDGQCRFCVALARRWARRLEPRGFDMAPLQDPRVRALLALPDEELLREMRVLTAEGKQLGGADAVVYLARHIWWTWPLYALAKLPGVKGVLRAAYRWVAARRSCVGRVCDAPQRPGRVLPAQGPRGGKR